MITITIKETGTSKNLQIINPQDNTDQTAEEITDNVNDFTARHDACQDAIGQVKAVILRKRLADNYRYYDDGEPSPIYCDGKSYTGWMYGNDECFKYNSDINDSEFYQLFVTVDGEVRKMYYEIPVDEDGEHLELDTINYDKPYRVGDDEAELWIDLD